MLSLISDYDGTLFFSRKKPQIRKEDIEKIHAFQKNHLFGLCTGRPWVGVSALKDYGIECDFYILTSGALILDKNQNVIYEKNIKRATIQSLLNEAKGFQNAIQAKSALYTMHKKNSYPMEQTIIHSLDEMTEEAVGFSIATNNEEEAKNICKKINETYDVVALQNRNCIDIVSKECSKGNAVKYIRKYLHLDHIGAIGDSYNDIDMLEEADLAFTFRSSPDKVKSVSNHIVNGVNEAIEIMINSKG